MIDQDSVLTTLYVMVDDFWQSEREAEKPHLGPQASLGRSEVITLALFGQWVHFPSERAFYRYAEHHLRQAFPRLPDRSQFNRLQRTHRDAITAFALFLVQLVRGQDTAYQVLDSTAAATREAKRPGLGWLAGQADIAWLIPLAWSEVFPLP